ncbi:MAG TPA: lytic transglycosylase domain-containing protein [Natronosporangium sp.]
MPRHVREEYRIARAAAVGAAGAVVVGAAFGIVGGTLTSGGGNQTAGPPTNASLDQALQERAELAASRGFARAAVAPATSVSVSLAQAPQASPPPEVSSGGGSGVPLPEIPESCEVYSGNQAIACAMLGDYGWGIEEMPALVALWDHESGWNEYAQNPSSGAYGIPQALPGSKMASCGDDWETNPATQICWGLGYIQSRYGSPTAAYDFWLANGWY